MELQHHGIKGMRWGVRRTPEQLGRTFSPRNTTLLKNYSGPMYFITERKLTDKNLTPRVPSNFFTKNGYEDSNTKRVCFADDVGKCLTALSKNVSNKTFYVYKPKDVASHKVYKPNAKAVPDSSVTGELWITDPVSVSEVGKIKCTGDDGKPGKKFKYGNKTAELYGWNYEWVGDDKMELQHHGIKGMRWGVRRTDEQLARARGVHADYARAHSKKSVKQMSDQELRDRNNRLNAEEQYRRNRENSTAVGRGKRVAKKVVTGVAISMATVAVKKYMEKGKNKVSSEVLPKIKDRAIGPLMQAAGFALEKDFA